MLEYLRALVLPMAASLVLAACGGGNAASQLVKPPDYNPKDQSRSLQLEVTGELGGFWDHGRLARVVSNLVGNAITHGQDGPVTVCVRDEGEWVALEVRNRGAPIAQEALPALFEPFVRGKATGEGLGLGLYIVREIVRAHGGRVGVRSEGDKTIFTVNLPRTPPQPH